MFANDTDVGLCLLLVHDRTHGRTFILHLAFARPHGYVPIDIDILRLFSLFHALVARVGERIGFIAVQQRMGFCHVGDVGRRAHHRMH